MQFVPNTTDILAEEAVITEKVMHNGEVIVKPYEFYTYFSAEAIRLFMHFKAIYCLPTQELIDFLKDQVGDKSAIEIGCGLGIIGKALNIPATDNLLQSRPEIKLLYSLTGQPTIKYPKHVIKFDGVEAVKHYKPQVAIGAFITHKWNGKSGNQWAIEEPKILPLVEKYIHVGDEEIHKEKPLMKMPFTKYTPQWLLARGKNAFIGVWENK